MSKRLARLVAPLVTALIVGAVAVTMVVGSTSMRASHMGTNGPLTVAGDSTTYYYYDYLLPTPHDDGSAGWDSLTWDVRECDRIGLELAGDGDSLAYKIKFTRDGHNWITWVDSTVVNSAPARSFPPVQTDWGELYYSQFTHTFAGSLATPDFFSWQSVRLYVQNIESDSTSTGASASTVCDTIINLRAILHCGD